MEVIQSTYSVHLNYNDLTEVDFDDDNFAETTSCIYLKRNLLKTLSASIGRLKDLVQLYVASNYLEYLPEEVGDLGRLHVLDVSDNYLTRLPATLVKLKSLVKLQVSHNNFQQFPPEICHLQNLQVLEASRNNFAAVPPEICHCTKLKLLALDKNSLRTIPRRLFRLENLQELSLCGNKLRFLPHGVWWSDKLEMLNLDNNPLLTLPLSIQRLTTCDLGLHSCFPLQKEQHLEDVIKRHIQHILPDNVTEICIAGQSSVPCLQELAIRRIACTGSSEESRKSLNLPETWLERLSDPVGLCDSCNTKIFTSTFPLIMDKGRDGILYCGLFCSVDCVLYQLSVVSMNVIYPVLDSV